MNGIRCDKLSIAVDAVMVHSDKYQKGFDTVVTFFTQYINRKAPTLSVEVAYVAQKRPAKRQKTSISYGTFNRIIELKKCSREKYDSMLMAQQQQLYKLWKKNRLIMNKKTPESSKL